MARSGSVETNHIAATTKLWWWEFIWTSSYNGNTATVNWEIYARCDNAYSSWVANYGFGGNVNGTQLSFSGNFNKDQLIQSGSFVIGGGNTFAVSITAHPYSGNHTSSGYWEFTLDVAVQTPTVTCSASRGLEEISASMSVTNNGGASIRDYYIDLFSNSGCTNKVGTINGTSGTFTGLTPNTTYYARANASNGTYRGYSAVKTISTYDIAKITSAPNINHGENLMIGYSNPSGAAMEIGIFTVDGKTLANYRECSMNNRTFIFTDEELDAIYKNYGTENSLKIRVYIKTAGKYTSYVEIMITLTGNQKTIWVNINGEWHRSALWVKVDGEWHRAVLWTKVNNEWHRCI